MHKSNKTTTQLQTLFFVWDKCIKENINKNKNIIKTKTKIGTKCINNTPPKNIIKKQKKEIHASKKHNKTQTKIGNQCITKNK
jgi:hypothetical protein